MNNFDFPKRLYQLRDKYNVSAREMSLAIGQNPSYINNIEAGKNYPSMSGFFFICEYLGITPTEFFDEKASDPKKLNRILTYLSAMDDRQLACIELISKELTNKEIK